MSLDKSEILDDESQGVWKELDSKTCIEGLVRRENLKTNHMAVVIRELDSCLRNTEELSTHTDRDDRVELIVVLSARV